MATPPASQQQHCIHDENDCATLLTMRRHRSLDGGQFLTTQLNSYNDGSYAPYRSTLEPVFTSQFDYTNRHSQPYDQQQQQQQQIASATANQNYQQIRYEKNNFDSQGLMRPKDPNFVPYRQKQQQQLFTSPPNSLINPSIGTSAFTATQPLLYATSDGFTTLPMIGSNEDNEDLTKNVWDYYQPVSAQAILQNIDFDIHALRREFIAICDRFNYLAASVRTFWAPELQQEKKRRKEYALRVDQYEHRFAQFNSDMQMLRMELERYREQEKHSHPRDFTDHSITLHEWQTLKRKLERSELNLSERTRELQNTELQAKCSQEQKDEIERRNEILVRTNLANENQIKLLQEDLNVLRGKLELKNQQLETKEKANENLDAQLNSLRLELKGSQQTVQEGERRIAMLIHRLDQMERESREKESQLESLKQRILQQPNTRIELELKQKLDNVQEDRAKLEQLIDQLRQQNETERREQLQQFLVEREQFQANITYLKKELADRHVLIGSQSEKISQLDSVVKNATQNNYDQQQQAVSAVTTTGAHKDNTTMMRENGDVASLLQDGKLTTKTVAKEGQQHEMDSAALELERTHREVDRLLKRVQHLERERAELINSIPAKREDEIGIGMISIETTETGTKMSVDEQMITYKNRQRIRELEEALRESVECTAEKEKSLTEQKQLVEKLSFQINEMFESTGTASAITSHQRQLRDAITQLENTQKQLEEEREQRKRQVSILRKEFGLALVAEKEAAISLIQNSCSNIDAVPGLREKLDTLLRVKETLKHSLLMSSSDTAEEQRLRQQDYFGINGIPSKSETTMIYRQLHHPAMQTGRPLTTTATTSLHYPFQELLLTSPMATTSSLTQPIRIHTTGLYSDSISAQKQRNNDAAFGISAPASLNLYMPTSSEFAADGINSQMDEEGIWA